MNYISPNVSSAIIRENHTLIINFENGEVKTFDMKPYLKFEVFEELKNIEEFKKIYIDFGTVCWMSGAGLSNDTFYIKGVNV